MKAAIIDLLALAATSAAAAPAAPPPRFNPAAPENRQLLPTFSYATVEPVLAQIGARHRRAGTAPAKPVLHVQFANNRTAVLVFGSCNSAGTDCKALSLQSHWRPIANSPRAATGEAIERFNQRFSLAKAFVAADGGPSLQRYLIADYGVVRGNLAVNLLAFAQQAESFATDVLRPLEAAK
ncbi:MAG TPA: YbjN domain-containing protein [Allosphingosinicella sp.]|nr:YbjN domain-containing protein [Allosphingosinicella sp.]